MMKYEENIKANRNQYYHQYSMKVAIIAIIVIPK